MKRGIIMNYEIVDLKEKTVAGFSARTSNASPDMTRVIGELWNRLYSPEGCPTIKNRVNEKSIGIYTDYSSDEKGDYTAAAGFEIDNVFDKSGDIEFIKIPKGRYARFVVRGNMVKAVNDFWQELWQMKLDRAFVCDFEEYQNADPDNAEIYIYIGLK